MPTRYLPLAILAAGLFFAPGCKQDTPHASITGTIDGLYDPAIFLNIPTGDTYNTEPIPVKDGAFSWSGDIPEVQRLMLRIGDKTIPLYMDNSAVEIHGHIDSLDQLRITGSAPQADFDEYQRSLADIRKEGQALTDQWVKAKENDSMKELIRTKFDSLNEVKDERTNKFIATHPGSVVSVSLLSDMALVGDPTLLDSLFRKLSPAMVGTTPGKALQERIAVLKKSAVGQTLMDFKQTDVKGDTFKLADLKGKYVLIDFWASWCKPCRAENPNLLKAYNQFKHKNFTVLGVSLDEKKESWQQAIAEDKMPWVQVSDLQGFQGKLAQEYGIKAIPCNFLIDPKGVIIARYLRGEALEEKLVEVLR